MVTIFFVTKECSTNIRSSFENLVQNKKIMWFVYLELGIPTYLTIANFKWRNNHFLVMTKNKKYDWDIFVHLLPFLCNHWILVTIFLTNLVLIFNLYFIFCIYGITRQRMKGQENWIECGVSQIQNVAPQAAASTLCYAEYLSLRYLHQPPAANYKSHVPNLPKYPYSAPTSSVLSQGHSR